MNRKNSLLLPPQFFETDSDKKIRTILDLGVDALYLFDHFKNPADSTKPTYIFTEEIFSLYNKVKNEIESLGGSLEKSVKMGKKYFTRELNKEKSGHYVVLVFNIEGSKIDAFKARLKLSTDVFRYQFSVLSEINSLASEV